MNEHRMIPCLIGTGLSWSLAAVTWSQVAIAFAIVASIATAWAGVETALWRRKQRRDRDNL